MYVRRLNGTIEEKIAMENTIAKTAQLEANVDYIAMMADIDLTEEEVKGDESNDIEKQEG
jgi:hypothetical protein